MKKKKIKWHNTKVPMRGRGRSLGATAASTLYLTQLPPTDVIARSRGATPHEDRTLIPPELVSFKIELTNERTYLYWMQIVSLHKRRRLFLKAGRLEVSRRKAQLAQTGLEEAACEERREGRFAGPGGAAHEDDEGRQRLRRWWLGLRTESWHL